MHVSDLFDHGYSINGEPQLALYEPVMGSFLLTLHNIQVAQQVKLLASSRYQLMICCLDKVLSRSPNLIDNECCENWSISDQDFDVGLIQKQWSAQDISKVFVNANPDPQTQQEKQWLLVLWHWTRFFWALKNTISTWYPAITEISKLWDKPGLPPVNIDVLEREIKQCLYFGSDSQSAHDQCLHLLAQYPKIQRIYHTRCPNQLSF